MKYSLSFILLLFIFASCSNDSTSDGNNEFATDGQGGSLAKFTLRGDYLYTVDENDLNVFNVSDTRRPVLVNTVTIGFGIETLFSYGSYLYIGSRNGMFIYTVDNPEFPVQLSEVQHFTSCDPVVANENYAFVTLWSELGCGTTLNQLEIYDIEDPTSPILLSVRNLTFPKGLGLYGDYLFVCDDEIKVFDVSNPEESILVHAIDRLAFDVIIRGNLLIAVGETGLFQYALNPENIEAPEFLSAINY